MLTVSSGSSPAGGPLVPGLPISRLAHWLLHTSNTVFLKCGLPFLFLAPCCYILATGLSVLNLNKKTYCMDRMCLWGNKETEEHLLLNCSIHSVLRVDLMQAVKSILLKEGLQDLLSSVLHNHSRLLQLLLFGHPLLKLKPTTNMYNAVSKYLQLTSRFTSPWNLGFLY